MKMNSTRKNMILAISILMVGMTGNLLSKPSAKDVAVVKAVAQCPPAVSGALSTQNCANLENMSDQQMCIQCTIAGGTTGLNATLPANGIISMALETGESYNCYAYVGNTPSVVGYLGNGWNYEVAVSDGIPYWYSSTQF